jgi:hypothetical protein
MLRRRKIMVRLSGGGNWEFVIDPMLRAIAWMCSKNLKTVIPNWQDSFSGAMMDSLMSLGTSTGRNLWLILKL